MRFQRGNKLGRKFQPGQSGNPGGRPKIKLLSQAYREALEALDSRTRKEVCELIAKALIRKAMKGDVRAAIELADRTEGKSPQAVKLSADIDAGAKILKALEEGRRRVAEL